MRRATGYGEGKETLPSGALFGPENKDIGLENTYFWGVNDEQSRP